MSTVVQISSCTGWFHVSGEDPEWKVFRVAAWAVLDNGDTVGLIPVEATNRGPDYARLGRAPRGGVYIQESQMNAAQRLALLVL